MRGRLIDTIRGRVRACVRLVPISSSPATSPWQRQIGSGKFDFYLRALQAKKVPASQKMLRCITALALVATAWGQLPPQPSPPPEPPPSPPPPSPPADWNKCQLATDAYQAACTEPALGIYSDNLTANAAYCSNVACKYALLNATFYCPDPCETTGTLGPTAVLEINATSRLAFCDTCTSARVKVSTACGSATLPSEGIPADPIAAYCTNTECSRALSDMM